MQVRWDDEMGLPARDVCSGYERTGSDEGVEGEGWEVRR